MSRPLPPYQSPWLSYADQVTRLAQRGLSIPDPAVAERFLAHVNYYRFSGYCRAFERQRNAFLPGVTFDDIVGAYAFDAVLRDLLTEALEVIEIDFRACLAYRFGQNHGAFGHIDTANFFAKFNHTEWLARLHEEIARSSEPFIADFRRSYAEYPDLPVWMLTEVIPFGPLTRMFRGMFRRDQDAVCSRYGFQASIFGAILLHMAYVRNLCAHHAQLWDRVWSIRPTLPLGKMWRAPAVLGNDRLFSTLCLIQRLLKACPATGNFATDWRDRLHPLLAKPPNTPLALGRMGMPANWNQHPVWK
jgi:abortive infection bacteriophage resistance protein